MGQVKEEIKSQMTKAAKTASKAVGKNVAGHVVFHHHHRADGTVSTTAVGDKETAAEKAAEKKLLQAKALEAEKEQLEQDAQDAAPGSEAELEKKSEEEKTAEKLMIAKETAKEMKV